MLPSLFVSGFFFSFFQLTGLIRFTKACSSNLDEEMNERAEEAKNTKQKAPYFHFRGNQASSPALCFGIQKLNSQTLFCILPRRKEYTIILPRRKSQSVLVSVMACRFAVGFSRSCPKRHQLIANLFSVKSSFSLYLHPFVQPTLFFYFNCKNAICSAFLCTRFFNRTETTHHCSSFCFFCPLHLLLPFFALDFLFELSLKADFTYSVSPFFFLGGVWLYAVPKMCWPSRSNLTSKPPLNPFIYGYTNST